MAIVTVVALPIAPASFASECEVRGIPVDMEERGCPSFRPDLLPYSSANWLDDVRVELTNRKILWVIAWLSGLILGGLLRGGLG